MTSTTNCSICRGETRSIITTNSGFGILRCNDCKLVFSYPVPSEQDLVDYYQGFSYAAPAADMLNEQIAYTQKGADRFLKLVANKTDTKFESVLDYGGGLGLFANAIAAQIPDVTLFDLDKQSLQFAQDTFPGRFKIAASPEEALDRKYDYILLNQVIEHVRDPVEFLASFTKSLTQDGIITVTTPNNATDDAFYRPDIYWHYGRSGKSGFRKLITDSFLCCDPPRHLYAFNADNLRRIALAAGLKQVWTETAYWHEDPFGQPKYTHRGWGTLRATAWTLLFKITSLTGIIAKALDGKRKRGTTLITHFRVARASAIQIVPESSASS